MLRKWIKKSLLVKPSLGGCRWTASLADDFWCHNSKGCHSSWPQEVYLINQGFFLSCPPPISPPSIPSFFLPLTLSLGLSDGVDLHNSIIAPSFFISSWQREGRRTDTCSTISSVMKHPPLEGMGDGSARGLEPYMYSAIRFSPRPFS